MTNQKSKCCGAEIYWCCGIGSTKRCFRCNRCCDIQPAPKSADVCICPFDDDTAAEIGHKKDCPFSEIDTRWKHIPKSLEQHPAEEWEEKLQELDYYLSEHEAKVKEAKQSAERELFKGKNYTDGYCEGQKEERERIIGIIEEASQQIHGGGNGRRILTELIAKIKK